MLNGGATLLLLNGSNGPFIKNLDYTLNIYLLKVVAVLNQLSASDRVHSSKGTPGLGWQKDKQHLTDLTAAILTGN